VDEVLDRVRMTGLLTDGRPVVALLSGGRDSVCLLDCAVALGADVTALHVNYGLRDDAGEDEEHCRELCQRLGVELAIEHATKPENAGNTQAWARDRRIGVAARLALARRGVVATGHTATDQAETVLYRLAASPGRRALLGMSQRDGLLIRPLLQLTRAETAAYNEARGLTWREDPTNATDRYARNRIRHELTPVLERISPSAVQTINRTAELLRDEAEVLDVVVDTALAGRDRIAIGHLALLPRALARLVVRRLAEEAVGGLCGRAATRLDDILELRRGALDLGDGVRAVVEDGMLRMVPTPPLRAHA
jgi:tRNA(Ile)-lysidine synthase